MDDQQPCTRVFRAESSCRPAWREADRPGPHGFRTPVEPYLRLAFQETVHLIDAVAQVRAALEKARADDAVDAQSMLSITRYVR